MDGRTFFKARTLVAGLAFVALAFGAGCSSARRSAESPAGPRVRWYAHCDSCKWCKGGFKTTQEVQEEVTLHNKQIHDWYKVAYYDQVKCP